MKLFTFLNDQGYAVELHGSIAILQPGNPDGTSWTNQERMDHALSTIDNLKQGALLDTQYHYFSKEAEAIMSEPYVDSDGNKWDPTFESVQKMYAAVQMVEEAMDLTNAPDEVVLYDLDYVGHLYSVVTAKALLLQMGQHLQTILARKQKIKYAAKHAFDENYIERLFTVVAPQYLKDGTNPDETVDLDNHPALEIEEVDKDQFYADWFEGNVQEPEPTE